MATIEAFVGYARDTAGTIMRLAALALYPEGGPAVEEAAAPAGMAMALTDALRGFGRSASRRQLFVPADILARHGVDAEAVFAGQMTAGLGRALREVRELARAHLSRALPLIAKLPIPARPAFLPLAVLPLYLDRMEGSDYAPFGASVDVPQWRRQWRLWRAARAWLR
jgi:phytoene synthase